MLILNFHLAKNIRKPTIFLNRRATTPLLKRQATLQTSAPGQTTHHRPTLVKPCNSRVVSRGFPASLFPSPVRRNHAPLSTCPVQGPAARNNSRKVRASLRLLSTRGWKRCTLSPVRPASLLISLYLWVLSPLSSVVLCCSIFFSILFVLLSPLIPPFVSAVSRGNLWDIYGLPERNRNYTRHKVL